MVMPDQPGARRARGWRPGGRCESPQTGLDASVLHSHTVIGATQTHQTPPEVRTGIPVQGIGQEMHSLIFQASSCIVNVTVTSQNPTVSSRKTSHCIGSENSCSGDISYQQRSKSPSTATRSTDIKPSPPDMRRHNRSSQLSAPLEAIVFHQAQIKESRSPLTAVGLL